MKNLRTSPFETYRKQAKSLKVSSATREKTLEKIRELEKESASEERPENRPTLHKAAAAPQATRRKRAVAMPLKIAACLALVAAVGSVALSPPLFQQEEQGQAIAGSPILPFYRVYLDFNQAGGQPDSGGKLVDTVPFFLSLPGDLPDNYTVRFKNTDGVFFIPRGAALDESSRDNIIRITDGRSGRIRLDAAYATGLTPTEALSREEELYPEDRAGYSLISAVEFIKRLRDCEITVEVDNRVLSTYTINFGSFESCRTDQAIAEQLRAESNSMTFFALEEADNA